MKCWHCGADYEDFPGGRVPFRATCESCSAWLHCCKNCQNYQPGLPNDCRIPDTESIADREASNWCEEFKLLGIGPQKTGSSHDAEKRLFGETDLPSQRQDSKSKFDSLFDK